MGVCRSLGGLSQIKSIQVYQQITLISAALIWMHIQGCQMPHEPWSIWKRGFLQISRLMTGKSKMLDLWALEEGQLVFMITYFFR